MARSLSNSGQSPLVRKGLQRDLSASRAILSGSTARLSAEPPGREVFDVIENVGGHGTVGVLRNGAGKIVLVYVEMDALPILEEVGLPYASKVRMRDILDGRDGEDAPFMHTCGHDMHTVTLVVAANCLSAARERWIGTLIRLLKPAKECGGGAKAMVGHRLDEWIPLPIISLAQHIVTPGAGVLTLRSGPVLSALDSWHVRVFVRGGHGSDPERCVDPIVLAAHILVRLQSVISREVPPGHVAVMWPFLLAAAFMQGRRTT